MKINNSELRTPNSELNMVFFGTPDFAVPSLQALIDADLKPTIVITREDKPGKRGKDLIKSPVKILAEKHNIKILQPNKLDDQFVSELRTQNSELFVVVAYGKILPKNILDIPKYGTLNVHGSLLPRLRGASPIQTAILNGEKETGVTIMKMDEGMDTGDIITTAKVKDQVSKITADNLFEKMSKLGADLLAKTIPDYVSGKLKNKPQNNKKATYTKIIKKEDGHIDWDKNCAEIERETRAFFPWPGSYTFWNNKILKIIPPVKCNRSTVNHNPGTVFIDKNKDLAIACNNGYIIPSTLQLEGKSQMSSRNFLNGNQKIIGTILN